MLTSPHSRDLGHLELLHPRMQVPEHLSDPQHQVQFDAPLPHLDARDFERGSAEQGRLGMQGLEIAANGNGFGENGAVVEFERRDPLQRIDRGIALGLVLHGAEIDRLDRHLDPLLLQKNPHPPGIGRPPAIVKLHPSLPGFWRRFYPPIKVALKVFAGV